MVAKIKALYYAAATKHFASELQKYSTIEQLVPIILLYIYMHDL
jgi:hypothetical protein